MNYRHTIHAGNFPDVPTLVGLMTLGEYINEETCVVKLLNLRG